MELEATIVGKYSAVAPVLDERSRRRWAAAESAAIGYGGDALVSSATGLARETIRNGRREIARGEPPTSRIRAPGAGRPGIEQDQPGVLAALEALVDPLRRVRPRRCGGRARAARNWRRRCPSSSTSSNACDGRISIRTAAVRDFGFWGTVCSRSWSHAGRGRRRRPRCGSFPSDAAMYGATTWPE